jgi:hypothetical protein
MIIIREKTAMIMKVIRKEETTVGEEEVDESMQ